MAVLKSGDTAYEIPQSPVYDNVIRKLKNEDPAHADTIFNPLFSHIITNMEAVKRTNDGRAEKPVTTVVTLQPSKWLGSTIPFTQTVQIRGIVKTTTAESLVYVTPSADGTNSQIAGDTQILATAISADTITFTALKGKPTSNVNFIVTNAGTALK